MPHGMIGLQGRKSPRPTFSAKLCFLLSKWDAKNGLNSLPVNRLAPKSPRLWINPAKNRPPPYASPLTKATTSYLRLPKRATLPIPPQQTGRPVHQPPGRRIDATFTAEFRMTLVYGLPMLGLADAGLAHSACRRGRECPGVNSPTCRGVAAAECARRPAGNRARCSPRSAPPRPSIECGRWRCGACVRTRAG